MTRITHGTTKSSLISPGTGRRAIDVLLDRRLFVLDADRYDALMRALDHRPAPGPRLRALLRRVPAWRTESRDASGPNSVLEMDVDE